MRSSHHRRVALVTLAVFGGLVVAGNGLHLLPAWQHGPVLGPQSVCAHGHADCGFGQATAHEACDADDGTCLNGEGDDCQACNQCPICQFWAQGKLVVPPVTVSAVGPVDFHSPLGLPSITLAAVHAPFAARAPPIG